MNHTVRTSAGWITPTFHTVWCKALPVPLYVSLSTPLTQTHWWITITLPPKFPFTNLRITHSFAGIIDRGWPQRLVCIIYGVRPVSSSPHHRLRPDFSTPIPFFPARVFNHWLLLLVVYVFELMEMCLSNLLLQNLLLFLFENISGSTVMFLWVSINAMCHFQFLLNPL